MQYPFNIRDTGWIDIYVARVKEDINKLLKVGFIYLVDKATWLSSIIIVPKKNKKLWVCVDDQKLNDAAIVTNPLPLPFIDSLLDAIIGHEMYLFLDIFSGYNQVWMAPQDWEKTTFIVE